MEINLKPQLLIGHLLPGCFFLILFCLDYNCWKMSVLEKSLSSLNTTELIGFGIILLIAAFLLGEIFDSIRDGIIEYLLDKKRPIKWDFFLNAEEKRLTRFETYYFTFYIFNLNSAISLLIWGIVSIVLGYSETISFSIWFFVIASIFVLSLDAWQLRNEICKCTMKYK